jgi:hypothetical protein
VKNIGKDNIAAGESGPTAEQLALDQKANNDYIKYMIIFAVIFPFTTKLFVFIFPLI